MSLSPASFPVSDSHGASRLQSSIFRLGGRERPKNARRSGRDEPMTLFKRGVQLAALHIRLSAPARLGTRGTFTFRETIHSIH